MRFRPVQLAFLASLALFFVSSAHGETMTCPGIDSLIVRQYYESFSLKAEYCESGGQREGPSRSLFPDGKSRSQGFFHQGKMSGHWIRWYEYGAKRDEGDWEDGVPRGVWHFWDLKGVLTTRQVDLAADGLGRWRGFFELSWTGVFQGSGGQSFSPQLGWLPTFALGNTFAIRGDVDVSFLKNPTAVFVALSPEILIQYRAESWAAEVGGGIQSWLASGGGTAPIISAKISCLKSWKWIEREFFRYSFAAIPSGDTSHELSVGVGLSL